MNARSRAAGVTFLVLLIPTKELVFGDLVSGTPVDAGEYRREVDNEEILRAKTRTFLNREEIPYLDTLPALRESLANGVAPYPNSEDGHPNPAGYRAISRLVAAEMERRGLKRSAARKPATQSSANSLRQSPFSSY
jgi:lysophospholipase L1-like esterase